MNFFFYLFSYILHLLIQSSIKVPVLNNTRPLSIFSYRLIAPSLSYKLHVAALYIVNLNSLVFSFPIIIDCLNFFSSSFHNCSNIVMQVSLFLAFLLCRPAIIPKHFKVDRRSPQREGKWCHYCPCWKQNRSCWQEVIFYELNMIYWPTSL